MGLGGYTWAVRAIRWILWAVEHPAVGVYGCPLVIGGGVYLAIEGPGWWEEFFLDRALGWLIAFWTGSGFAFAWWVMRKQGDDPGAGGTMTAAIGGLLGMFLLLGVSAFTDPRLFAVSIWPGLAMLAPEAKRLLHGAGSAAEPVSPGESVRPVGPEDSTGAADSDSR